MTGSKRQVLCCSARHAAGGRRFAGRLGGGVYAEGGKGRLGCSCGSLHQASSVAGSGQLHHACLALCLLTGGASVWNLLLVLVLVLLLVLEQAGAGRLLPLGRRAFHVLADARPRASAGCQVRMCGRPIVQEHACCMAICEHHNNLLTGSMC